MHCTGRRVFADLVDEILRSRFLNVISSGKNELVVCGRSLALLRFTAVG